MRHHIIFSTLILSFAPACPAAAESTASDNLETVVVSATRSEQRREVTGASISVISAADIEVEHLDLVTEALKEAPGLTMVRNGGPGQPATIGLRGAGAGQTLFRIDGVRINDPTSTDTQAILGDS